MSPRLASIDALRGLAAAWVFAYHLWNVFAPGYAPQSDPSVPGGQRGLSFATPGEAAVAVTYPVFAYGYTGVGLFFVLSGFCIHLPQARRFARTGDDKLSLLPFFKRRAVRLYPAYFASLFLSAAGLLALAASSGGPDGGAVSLGTVGVLVAVNAVFLHALRPDALGLNGVYWTLAYEVQFYLAYPLLLRLCRQVGFRGVGAALLLIELVLTLAPHVDGLKQHLPPCEGVFLRRYFEWFMGVWLAERVANGKPLSRSVSATIAVAGFAAGVVGSRLPLLWPAHELFLTVGGFGAVAWLTHPASEPRAGGLWATVRDRLARVGDASYSLYLVHLPVMRLAFATEACLPPEHRSYFTFALAGALSAAAVPPVTWGWYRLFEKPFLPKPGAGEATITASKASSPLPAGERSSPVRGTAAGEGPFLTTTPHPVFAALRPTSPLREEVEIENRHPATAAGSPS